MQEVHLHFHEVSATIIARQNKAGSDVTAPDAADRVELSTSAIARLLTSDMREELLAIMREIFDRHTFADGSPTALRRLPNCWASPENSSTTCCAPASSDPSRQGAVG